MIQTSEIYCLHEKGARENNEDALWPAKKSALPADRLFIVCDGVGGSSAGEIASSMTCAGFADYFKKQLSENEQPGTHFLNQAHASTLAHFKAHIEKDPSARDMSTTLTLVYLNRASVMVAWCGDSRIYQIRNGEIVFQSQDHSLVNQLVKAGELTAEEAENYPQKNLILRAIQYKEKPSAIESVELTDVRPGDYLLLCTDGLLENINPGVLKDLLKEGEPAYGTGRQKNYADAIDAICKGKTKDNYSMYLIKLINE